MSVMKCIGDDLFVSVCTEHIIEHSCLHNLIQNTLFKRKLCIYFIYLKTGKSTVVVLGSDAPRE